MLGDQIPRERKTQLYGEVERLLAEQDVLRYKELMDLIAEIRSSWGWVGIEPAEIVGENDFGNLMIRDHSGHYWRLCPEDFYCEVVAENRQALDELSKDQEFLADWYMSPLVDLAREHIGDLSDGRKYCLAIPSVLGGEYIASNIKSAPLIEMIRLSGDIAERIQDLPDGQQIELKETDW